MTHHEHRDDGAIDQPTPFDEATDIIDAGDTHPDRADLVRIDRVGLPPAKMLVVLVAIVLSPLFALPFGLNAALLVLACAMAATAWLAFDGARRLVPEQAVLLRRAALVNAILALMALALLIVRVLA